MKLKSSSSRRGAALPIVLWVTLGLVSVALYFGQDMAIRLQSASNREAGAQAEAAVEGAANYVRQVLTDWESPGTLPLPNELLVDTVPLGNATFWIVGRDPSSITPNRPTFGLIDEASKLNLNAVTRDMLLKLPNMTESIASAIIDWRDEDEEPSEYGAESETYARLQPSYASKNAPFESLEELRLVYGVTEALLLGEDVNRNGILDPNENDGNLSPPADDSDGVLDVGWLEYLTLYSNEPNIQTNGEPRIVVGSATSNQALSDHLNQMLGQSRANEIFSIVSSGTYTNLIDFYLASRMTEQEFALVDDALTTTTNSFMTGLVNVNTASAAVLACLPGLEAADADSLVNYRTSNGGTFQSVAWVVDVLTTDKARAIGGWITDKSWQYTADISATGKNDRGYRRSWMVFDASADEPTILYRRDMARAGWALGAEWRREIAELRKNPSNR